MLSLWFSIDLLIACWKCTTLVLNAKVILIQVSGPLLLYDSRSSVSYTVNPH